MEDIIDNITSLVEDIRTELEYADNAGLEHPILQHCRHIDSELCELADAVAKIKGDELRSMLPDDITAGDAISLKETINNWRREHGYGEL